MFDIRGKGLPQKPVSRFRVWAKAPTKGCAENETKPNLNSGPNPLGPSTACSYKGFPKTKGTFRVRPHIKGL